MEKIKEEKERVSEKKEPPSLPHMVLIDASHSARFTTTYQNALGQTCGKEGEGKGEWLGKGKKDGVGWKRYGGNEGEWKRGKRRSEPT